MRTIFTLLTLALAAHLHAADPRVGQSNLSGGLACFIHPEAADEAPLDLAAEGKFLVYVAAKDEPSAAELRRRAATRGLLGRSVYVEPCPDGTLPFGDHFADLVLAPDSANEAEILRVLAPLRGRAFLGEKVLTKPLAPGMDDWTHRLHAADNNPVSGDTAFQGPPQLQWLATPLQGSFQGGMLVAGGRRIELSDWVTKKADRNAVAGAMRGRSLHNGLLLWERELPHGIEPDMPLCALDDRHVYLATGDACAVLVIDAETGAELRRITPDTKDADLRVNWLGLENGRLHLLLGPPLEVRTALQFMGGANAKRRGKQFEAGNTLVAWDLAEDRELWRHVENHTIDYRTVAVRGGRVFFYAEQSRLVCLDAEGREQWQYGDPAFIARLPRPNRLNINTEGTASLIVGPKGTLRFAVPGRDDSFLFDSEKGSLLWEDKLKAPKCLFLDATYLTPRGVFDAFTGSQVGEVNVNGSGCGIMTWAPGLDQPVDHVSNGVKSPCGVGAFAAGGLLHYAPSQCDCWPHVRGGAAFGSGKAVFASAAKGTHPLVKGSAATSSLRAADGDWPEYRGGGQRRGTVSFAAGSSATLAAHVKAAHPLPVPEGHDLHCMEWLERLTPPVTAGGMAFSAGSDGSVRAVDLAAGKEGWTYHTGGAVLTAPVFADGALFVGSADGWLHCLNAADGSLRWRWRGAPMDHAMMVYGKLMSAWPVTSVMHHDGVVYGVAGMWMQNGSVTFALDAATGEARWTTWTAPHDDPRDLFTRDDHGFGPCGYLAMVGPHLWVRTHLGIPAVFDAETGQGVPPGADYLALGRDGWNLGFRTATAGQDILVLDDRTVIQGGTPLLSNPDMRHDKSAAKYLSWFTGKDGRVTAAPLPQWAVPHSQIAPAVDQTEALLVGGVGKDGRSANSTLGLSLWDVEVWKAEHTAIPGARPVADDPDAADPSAPKSRTENRDAALAEIRNFKTTLDMQKAAWRLDAMDVSAIALTPDAAIVAHGSRQTFGRSQTHPGFTGWKLTAFDRAGGKERWSVDLPGEPVFNGLAPAAGGAWVLTQRDGSVAVVR